MNPECMGCENPSIKVCIHPKCQSIPFLCQRLCKNQTAEEIHKHDSKMFIPYQQLEQYIIKICTDSSPQLPDKYTKRINIIQDQINLLVKKANQRLQSIQYKLSQFSSSLVEKILAKDAHSQIKGKDIHKLIEEKDKYDVQTSGQIAKIQKQIDKKLTSIENILAQKQSISSQKQKMQQLKRNFMKFYEKGKAERQKKQPLFALRSFIVASHYTPFQDFNELAVVQALGEITIDHRIKHYKHILDLGAEGKIFSLCMVGLSRCYLAKQDFKEALKWVNKCRQIESSAVYLYVRGLIYTQMKCYNEAIVEFTKAIKICPTKQSFSKRGLCYKALGKEDQASEDLLSQLQVQLLK